MGKNGTYLLPSLRDSKHNKSFKIVETNFPSSHFNSSATGNKSIKSVFVAIGDIGHFARIN